WRNKPRKFLNIQRYLFLAVWYRSADRKNRRQQGIRFTTVAGNKTSQRDFDLIQRSYFAAIRPKISRVSARSVSEPIRIAFSTSSIARGNFSGVSVSKVAIG